MENKKLIPFTEHFKITSVISALAVLGALFLVIFKGLHYGVDFAGGAEIQMKFSEEISAQEVRQVLLDAKVKGVIVQTIGELSQYEFLLKVPAQEKDLNQTSTAIAQLYQSKFSQGVEIRKTDIVGPKAGRELRMSGFKAMLWALLAILVYVGLRFDFKYSPGGIVALFHDVLIILGIFVLIGADFNLQVVAALLAVIGYSVNDTVVVYDRVREHEVKFTSRSLKEHINYAINETLSRTILTSCTTLFVSLALFIFGGTVIRDFFLTISLGVVIGTYSSIYVAAPATLFFSKLFPSEE